MSLDSDARAMAEKDFKARYGSRGYDPRDPEMKRYMEVRFKHWVGLIAERRGHDKRHAVETLTQGGF